MTCAGDRVVAVGAAKEPRVGDRDLRPETTGAAYVWLCDLPADQQRAILPYVRDFPGSEGLFIQASPDGQAFPAVPNAATITVRARYSDWTVPLGAAFSFQTSPQTTVEYPRITPAITGPDADWTIHNLEPGLWPHDLRGNDFWVLLGGPGGEPRSPDGHLDLLLRHGGRITGRVVRAETGEPVAGAGVSTFGRNPGMTCMTDEQGWYTLENVAPGPAQVEVWLRGLAGSRAEVGAVPEGGTLVASDMALTRGGYIAGRIAPPPGMPADSELWGSLRAEHLDGPWVPVGTGAERDFTFRIGPLAEGTHRVRAEMGTSAGKGAASPYPPRRWEGEVTVTVEAGRVLRGVEIPVSEVERE